MASPFPDKLSSVALGTGAPYGWALTHIEHAELNGGGIRDQTHLSAQGINLTHNLTFGNATHGRIARHLPNLVHVHRHQAGLRTHVGCCTGSLAACMSTSDDNHIVV
jgi:hypothetical protein